MPLFTRPDTTTTTKLPLFITPVPAGFPSPAEEYSDTKLDLNRHLIGNPNSTFFVAIIGDSMADVNIQSSDIAIVDRSLEAKNGSIILAVIDGEFTIKRLEKIESKVVDGVRLEPRVRLLPENSDFNPIEITENMVFQVWGVVTYTIHRAK